MGMLENNTPTGPQALSPARGRYSRGYLPHIDLGPRPVFLTFGLAAAIPARLYHQWMSELLAQPPRARAREMMRRVEQYWDRHPDSRLLGDPAIAALVWQTIRFDAGRRFRLHAWVIMPSHVHVLLTPFPGVSLERITHAMKHFSARRINRQLGRKGRLWLPESYDRYVRGPAHFDAVWQYIEYNPVKAGLCERPEDWAFSSASQANAPAVRDPCADFGSFDAHADITRH